MIQFLSQLIIKNAKRGATMSNVMAGPGVCGDWLRECVACGTERIRYWGRKSFQYTDGARSGEFLIYRCDHCGTGFLNRPPHANWLKSIYRFSGQALTNAITLNDVLAREAKYPNVILDADSIAVQANRFDRSGISRALDIGSGFGFYTRALRKIGYQTVSINPGQYENAVFKELNGDEPLGLAFETYQTSARFGVVLMSQVLEHLLEPDQAIRKVSGILAPGGVFACAVPNYNSFLVKLLGTRDNACLWVPEHVNYFSVNGLKTLMEKNGLNVIQIKQVTRIPYQALSKRLGLTNRAASIADTLVEYLQIPLARLMNFFGLGIYIHLYAVKK